MCGVAVQCISTLLWLTTVSVSSFSTHFSLSLSLSLTHSHSHTTYSRYLLTVEWCHRIIPVPRVPVQQLPAIGRDPTRQVASSSQLVYWERKAQLVVLRSRWFESTVRPRRMWRSSHLTTPKGVDYLDTRRNFADHFRITATASMETSANLLTESMSYALSQGTQSTRQSFVGPITHEDSVPMGLAVTSSTSWTRQENRRAPTQMVVLTLEHLVVQPRRRWALACPSVLLLIREFPPQMTF